MDNKKQIKRIHKKVDELQDEYFQLLIDVALKHEGSYFLTYHRWARKDQLLEAYPQFPMFLERKLKYDPQEMFQSDWYRFYKKMFSNNE